MGSIQLKNFTGGLDTRALPEVTQGGVLIVGTNGHISRGGAFEKRAAFVEKFDLPSYSIGLTATAQTLVTFGSRVAPAMPAGIVYQRLAHPTNAQIELVRVLKAELFSGKVYAVGLFADGSRHHFFDGVYTADWFDGRARATFSVLAADDTTVIKAINVGGINIIAGTEIPWAGSINDTVAQIVQSINGILSDPDYEATQFNNAISLTADVVGTAANGLTVTIVTEGTWQIDPTTVLTMQGGAVTAGTFEPGTFVKTYQQKMYSTSGSVLHFSGIKEPTKWNKDTAIGAGFIDLAEEGAGFEELTSISVYMEYLAIFAPSAVMIYYFDPDPNLSRRRQTLEGVGTSAPNSVAQIGGGDILFLDESGIRSLQARDNTNSAMSSDIGNPIDTLVTADLAEITIEERARLAIGLQEPVDGRFWMILGRKIYVFSYFQGSRISAWTTYEVPFEIEYAIRFRRRIYVRAGSKVYVYGGEGVRPVYDDTKALAWLPFLDANAPLTEKQWNGLDAVARGQWKISAAFDPNRPEIEGDVARVSNTTYNTGRIGMGGRSTHISLRFESEGEGFASISAAAIHHDLDPEEDSG